MKIFNELSIILLVFFMGELINRYIISIVPGTVLGMVILLFLLIIRIIRVKDLEVTSDFLLKNLSFFFIPASVGLITVFDLVSNKIIQILLIMIITTIIVILTTGLTVQFLKRKMKK